MTIKILVKGKTMVDTNQNPRKISYLVFLYTVELSLFTLLFIFIFAFAKIHEVAKIGVVKSFYLRFLIYFLQYFYLYLVRYRKAPYSFSFQKIKVDYHYDKEKYPFFIEVFIHWLISIGFLIPYKVYFIIYSILVKILFNEQLISNFSIYFKNEILDDGYIIFQIIYCFLSILFFISQTIRKSKYVTFSMLLRKVEFVQTK